MQHENEARHLSHSHTLISYVVIFNLKLNAFELYSIKFPLFEFYNCTYFA